MKRRSFASVLMLPLYFAKSALAQQPGSPRRARRDDSGQEEAGSDLNQPPLPKDEGEKSSSTLWSRPGRASGTPTFPTADGRLMRQLTEALGAQRVVELGTSTGESGLWFSLALRKTGGQLDTHDIDAGRIAVARANFKRAGVEDLIAIVRGRRPRDRRQEEGPDRRPVHRRREARLRRYLKELLPRGRPGGLILAHNMHCPAPDPRYLEAITTNPDLDSSFVLMDGPGLGITLKKR